MPAGLWVGRLLTSDFYFACTLLYVFLINPQCIFVVLMFVGKKPDFQKFFFFFELYNFVTEYSQAVSAVICMVITSTALSLNVSKMVQLCHSFLAYSCL